jgi:2-oxo-4-hydroxy-4-carboxy-5-ureidoimidazoline decarboxylase
VTPAASALDVGALDAMPAAAFVARIGPLFERAPEFLYRLSAARPFGTTERLFARAREIAHAMPEDLQLELVDAHPRLGAPPESVSPMSFREQGYDQLAAPNPADEAAPERVRVDAELDRLNREYEGTFGFRYCVFVAGRSREALLAEFEAALGGDRKSELHRALDAVIDIAEARSRG